MLTHFNNKKTGNFKMDKEKYSLIFDPLFEISINMNLQW